MNHDHLHLSQRLYSMGVINLTFYSQKLWHSDKPFPKTSPDQKSWYHSAYEVVNPEVIPWTLGGFERCVDGDKITLPDGYGIKERKYRQRGEVNGPERREATITLPEKPYRSPYQFQDCHSFCVNGPNYCNMNHCDENGCNERKREMVEPSESQEETHGSVISDMLDRYCKAWYKATKEIDHQEVVNDFKRHFTITRK